MAVPVIILGAAGIAAIAGAISGSDAVAKNSKAKGVNKKAQSIFDEAKESATLARDNSNKSLEQLGETKLLVLDKSILRFLATFEKIHNIKLRDSAGLDELSKFKLDKQSLLIMREMGNMATSVLGGLAGGAGAGALAAFGAYGATMTFAAASTGTAIASLSGVAATNATLAFLGGGALAAGGGGMALGSIVLGGVVAGPAILILGIVMNASARKNLDNAYTNKAEAEKLAEELKLVESLCNGIRMRSDMFNELLVKLDALFSKAIKRIEDIVLTSGYDYLNYSEDEQKSVAASMSIAAAIKKVLDTPILSEEGTITPESQQTHEEMQEYLSNASVTLA